MNAKEHVILVVDDNEDIRETMRELLSFEGYQVVTAEHGQEALDLLRAGREKVSLILLDLMMPVLDGWQFRELQQKDEALSRIPVIILTASGDARSLSRQTTVLQKPVQFEELLAAVSVHC
jgi:CheY-like chemotaxis protein